MPSKTYLTPLSLLAMFACFTVCGGGGTGSGNPDEDLYINTTLPSTITLDVPTSLSGEVAGSLVKTGLRSAETDYNSGLTELQEAVTSLAVVIIEEGIRLEYQLADAFYPELVQYIAASGESLVPENEICITVTEGFYDALVAVYTRYELTSAEAEALLSEEINPGEEICNPNMRLEELDADETGFDHKIEYWYDELSVDGDRTGVTVISWDDSRTKARITYDYDLGDELWTLTYQYNELTATQTLRDSYVADSGGDVEEYDEALIMQKCGNSGAGDCVELSYSESYALESTGYAERGFLSVFGIADNAGGFLEEETVYIYDEDGDGTDDYDESQHYRELVSGQGSVLDYYAGTTSGDDTEWCDSAGDTVTSEDFASLTSYFSSDFDSGSGFDLGLEEVTIDGLSGDGEYRFVIVFDPTGSISPSGGDFSSLIVGSGFYYSSGGSTQTSVFFWGDDFMFDEAGDLVVYSEDYNQADGSFEYTELAVSVVQAE